MQRRIVSLALTLVGIAAVTGCQLRKPFEGTVIAAGADGGKVKNGFFNRSQTVTDGEVNIDIDRTGRPQVSAFGVTDTSFSFEPLQIDDETVGQVTFDLLEDGPSESADLALLSWVDLNDNGRLDIDLNGDSEAARTITRFNTESGRKAVLTFYSYSPNGGDPFYNATALEDESVNVIVTEDYLTDWMAVLPGNVDKPTDTDGDGLSDAAELAIGTAIDSNDTDGDGIDDLTEVGDDPANPRDTDGDGIIDALSLDSDGDGVSDADEGTVDANENGIPAYRDPDEN
jgi:hypothetical protein